VAARAEQARDARRRRVAKRARERDHLADVARKAARELARVDTAQAPADQAEAAAVPPAQRPGAPRQHRPWRAAPPAAPARRTSRATRSPHASRSRSTAKPSAASSRAAG